MLFIDPYRLIAYRNAAIMLSTGFQMFVCPGTEYARNVGPITWAIPSDGVPAAALESQPL
jgi:hypothetical protein